MLIDSGVPRSATAPAQFALDRAIAAETGGSRDSEHQLWYVALTRARYAALIVVSDPDGGTTEWAVIGRRTGTLKLGSPPPGIRMDDVPASAPAATAVQQAVSSGFRAADGPVYPPCSSAFVWFVLDIPQMPCL